MSQSAYRWKMNLYNVDAQAAGNYLKQLEERDGEVIPSVMVEEAREDTALLHPCFEWDDAEAAEKYRIHQARGVIRNIAIVYERTEPKEPITVRAFVHTRENELYEPRYVHVETALSDATLKKQILETATRELNEFRRKYKNLVELADLFKSIDYFLSDTAEG